jgi:hypothetical protein
MDLLDELKNLITKLNDEKIEYALCGGLAMAVYALPRATLDIDMGLLPIEWAKLVTKYAENRLWTRGS